jgi:hypothetical protein
MLLARLRIGESLSELLSNIHIDGSSGDEGQFPLDPQMMER